MALDATRALAARGRRNDPRQLDHGVRDARVGRKDRPRTARALASSAADSVQLLHERVVRARGAPCGIPAAFGAVHARMAWRRTLRSGAVHGAPTGGGD